jgi:hypothetical protein
MEKKFQSLSIHLISFITRTTKTLQYFNTSILMPRNLDIVLAYCTFYRVLASVRSEKTKNSSK